MSKIYIGTSGWSHAVWRESFYPNGIKTGTKLEFYAQHFNSVEVNSTFYHLPQYKTWKGWRERTPENFVFSIKGSRFISHVLKLDNAREPLQILYRGARILGEKLGPIIFRLPDYVEVNHYRLEKFSQILPEKIKVAIEFDHPSWYQEKTYEILQNSKIALVINENVLEMENPPITGDFAYFRLPGGPISGQKGVKEEVIKEAVAKITKITESSSNIFTYFSNTGSEQAIFDGKKLKQALNC